MQFRLIYLHIMITTLFIIQITSAQETTFIQVDCDFAIPSNLDISCYQIEVPENRNNPNSVSIHLSITIIHNPTPIPNANPIVFLQGGPGGSTLASLNQRYAIQFEPIIATGKDIILFDQRGTGLSQPNLTCSDYHQVDNDLLDLNYNEQLLSSSEAKEIRTNELVACGERLSNAHDLAGYTTQESAHDISAIRQVLGYEKVDLWGVSYGTRLALTTMRDYPNIVGNVVLDSTYPLDVNLYTALPSSFNRALQVLFEDCESNSACNRTFPNLESVLFDAMNHLDADPTNFSAINPANNQIYNIVFDSSLLLNVLFQSLYDTSTLPNLPQLIYDASENRFDSWRVPVGQLIARHDAIDIGVHYAVQCHEEIAFTSPDAIQSAWNNFPDFWRYSLTRFTESDYSMICSAFSSEIAPETDNHAVISDIPTLIIAGAYDPITPPEWGMRVNQNLLNSQYVELPYTAHTSTLDSDCAQAIMIDFLSNPDRATVDTRCLDDLSIIFSGTIDGDVTPLDSADYEIFGITGAR